jgi:hypothetical protein
MTTSHHRKSTPISMPSGFGLSILITLCALAPELWSSDAWGQQRRTPLSTPVAVEPLSPKTAPAAFLPNTDPRSSDAWGQQRRTRLTPVAVLSPKTAPAVGLPNTDPNSALGSALVACDKESDRSEPFSLPGAKGEVKLDRCYRGRGSHICSNNALLKEGRSLLQDYAKIIEAAYPDLSNVNGVCAIIPAALSTDVQNAAEFTNRFKALSAEYAARSTCATRISQSLREVVLPDMAQASEMIKSMVESIEGDSKDLSVVQAQVVELAGKIDASQKAMVTIGKIHQAMCFNQRTDTVSDAKN